MVEERIKGVKDDETREMISRWILTGISIRPNIV
jgi:hypothetical protein